MSTFEKLATIASGTGEVWETARAMIGKNELALLLAKAAVDQTTESLSPTRVGKALGITHSGARKKIENAAIQESKKSLIRGIQ